MREIGDGHALVADLAAKLLQILMWPLEKVFEQAKLVHDFERRRMNGVTTKVAEEVRVFLEYDNVGARRNPSIIPAGPPPTMQQRLVIVLVGMPPCPMSPLWFDRIFFATRYLSCAGGVLLACNARF